MDEITAKEKILKDIRDALTNNPMEEHFRSLDMEGSVVASTDDYIDTTFAENFVRRGGRLLYCEDVEKVVQSLHILGSQEDWSANIYCGEDTIGAILNAAGLSYSNKPEEAVIKKIGCCSCMCLLAQTGSIVFDSAAVGRRLYASADVIIFFATIDQIEVDMKAAVRRLKQSGSFASSTTIWTGLSKIIDIDGEIRGGLGPNKVILVLIDQEDEEGKAE